MEPEGGAWEALEVAAEAGQLLIQSGAEVQRAEETVLHIARAYGWNQVEAVVMPTALFVSAPGAPAVVRRIQARQVNLATVAAVNQISRDLNRQLVAPAVLRQRLRQAAVRRAISRPTTVLVAALIAGWMSQLMGGGPADFPAASLSGALAEGVTQLFARTVFPPALTAMAAAVVATWPALAEAALGPPGLNPGAELVGGVMVLVPGLALTAAVRDAIAGDLLAAAARFLEGVMVVAAVAAGVSLSLYGYLHQGGRWP